MISTLTRDQLVAKQRRADGPPPRRPRRTSAWPFPQDTSTDRARTLANALLDALEAADPDKAEEIRSRAHGYGERWLGPGRAVEGPWLTRAEVAELAGVDPDTVSAWTSRGRLTRHPTGYSEREVQDLLAARRTPRTRQE